MVSAYVFLIFVMTGVVAEPKCRQDPRKFIESIFLTKKMRPTEVTIETLEEDNMQTQGNRQRN